MTILTCMRCPVSVLIPTYNRAHVLPETVDSILSQSLPPSEVIVVDDGSTDATQGCLRTFGDRVRYVRTENGGVTRARNIAAELSTYPYLAFCDSDDLWRKDKLEIQMDMHSRYPALPFSFTNFCTVSDGVWAKKTKFDDAPPGFFPRGLEGDELYFLCEEPLYNKLLEFQPIFPSTHVIKRDFFRNIGGYLDNLGRNPSEDLEFALRCAQHAPVGVVREAVVGYRKHETNFSGDSYKTTKGQIEILTYALSKHSIDDVTRSLILEQIDRRRVYASYDAFRRREFKEVVNLLSGTPSSYFDFKTRLKFWVSRMPEPIARAAHKALVRG